MSRPGALLPSHSHRFYGYGQACLDAVEGDLLLVRTADRVGAGIRFFERLRVPAQYAWCNHAAIVLEGGPDACVVQEEAKGAVVTPLAELGAIEYAVVHLDMTGMERAHVARFASWSVGQGYGFLSIPADAFNAITGLEIGFGWGNRMVCSTQATRALERSGYVPSRSPYAQTPAHLAQDFDVTVPAPLKVSVK